MHVGAKASLALRSVFSTLHRLAPLQSHNSRPGALRQMTLRALRCDGRVPRKSRYSRSGKPASPADVRGGATGGSQRSDQKTFPDPRLIGFRRRRKETFSRRREPPWQPPAPSPSKLRAVPDRKNVSDGGTPPWQPPRPDEKSKKGREANLKTVPLLMWYAGFLSRQPDTPSCHADPVASGAFCDKERQNGIKSRRDP